MMALVRAPQLRFIAGNDPGRKVTWLELFFDLIFVAAVAQVGEPLREDYTVTGLVRYSTLFVLIWWAWIGNSVFATRFNSDDVLQRVLTLVQMFAVAIIPLAIYAIRSAREDFTVRMFVLTNRKRLGYGFFLINAAAIILNIFPDARAVIGAVGFGAGNTDAALGLAIGGLLVASISGDKK